MTLVGAKKRIKEERKGVSAQIEVVDRLRKVREELLKMKEEVGVNGGEAVVG